MKGNISDNICKTEIIQLEIIENTSRTLMENKILSSQSPVALPENYPDKDLESSDISSQHMEIPNDIHPIDSISASFNFSEFCWNICSNEEEDLLIMIDNNRNNINNLSKDQKLLIYSAAYLLKRENLIKHLEEKELIDPCQIVELEYEELLLLVVDLTVHLHEFPLLECLAIDNNIHLRLSKPIIQYMISNRGGNCLAKLIGFAHYSDKEHLPQKRRTNRKNILNILDVINVLNSMPNISSEHIEDLLEAFPNTSEIENYNILKVLIKNERNELGNKFREEKGMHFDVHQLEFAFEFHNFGYLFPYYEDIKLYITTIPKISNYLVKHLLSGLEGGYLCLMDFQLLILEKLVVNLSLSNAKYTLQTLEHCFLNNCKLNGLYFTNNPLRVILTLIKIIEDIYNKFRGMKYIGEEIIERMIRVGRKIEDEMRTYEEMRGVLEDTDRDGRSAFMLIILLQLPLFLEHPIANEIIMDIWVSEYEMKATFPTSSTITRILSLFIPVMNAEIEHTTQPSNHPKYKSLIGEFTGGTARMYIEMEHIGMYIFWKSSAYMKSHIYILSLLLLCGLFTYFSIEFNTHVGHAATYINTAQNIYCFINYSKDPNICYLSLWEYVQLYKNMSLSLDIVRDSLIALFSINILLMLVLLQHIFLFAYLHLCKSTIYYIIKHNYLLYLKDFLQICLAIYIIWNLVIVGYERENMYIKYENHFLADAFTVQKLIDLKLNLLLASQIAVICFGIFICIKIIPAIGGWVKILLFMISQLMNFLWLYILQLLSFASVGYVAFGNYILQFDSFANSLFTLFGASLGNFEYAWFEELNPIYYEFGHIFLTIFLVLNLLILLNFLIAIVVDTYAKIRKLSHSSFLLELLSEFPKYSADAHHSSLVSTFFPLNILLAPFFLVLLFLNKSYKKKLNEGLLIIEYIPVFVILILMFIIVQIILLPFAYFVNLWLIITKSQSKNTSEIVGRFILFSVFGILILLFYMMRDSYWFSIALICTKRSKLDEKWPAILNEINFVYDSNIIPNSFVFFNSLEGKLLSKSGTQRAYQKYLNHENNSLASESEIGLFLEKENTFEIARTDIDYILDKAEIKDEEGLIYIHNSALSAMFKTLIPYSTQEISLAKLENPLITTDHLELLIMEFYMKYIKLFNLRRVSQALNSFSSSLNYHTQINDIYSRIVKPESKLDVEYISAEKKNI